MSDSLLSPNSQEPSSLLKRQTARMKDLLLRKWPFRYAAWQKDPAAMERWIALAMRHDITEVTSEVDTLYESHQVAIIHVRGLITRQNAGGIMQEALSSLEKKICHVVLDLSQAFAVAAADLSFLIGILSEFERANDVVVLVTDEPDMLAMLDESGINNVFRIFPTAAEALAYLRSLVSLLQKKPAAPAPPPAPVCPAPGAAAPPKIAVQAKEEKPREIILGEPEVDKKRRASPPAKPSPKPVSRPEPQQELARGISFKKEAPPAPAAPAGAVEPAKPARAPMPPVLGGMLPPEAKPTTVTTERIAVAEKKKEKKPEARRDEEQAQRQQAPVDDGTGLMAMPDKAAKAPKGGKTDDARRPSKIGAGEREVGGAGAGTAVSPEGGEISFGAAEAEMLLEKEELPAEEDKRRASELQKEGERRAPAKLAKEAEERKAEEEVAKDRVTITRAGGVAPTTVTAGKKKLAEPPSQALNLMPRDLRMAPRARLAHPWLLPFRLLLLPFLGIWYVGKGVFYVGRGVVVVLYKFILLPKLAWDALRNLRRRILEKSKASGMPWFELLLGDDAGRPGSVERAAAQSVLFLRAMQATIGLKFILLANAVDIVLEALASYIGSIFRTWKMMKTIQRRLKRELKQSQVQSVLEDLMVGRIRLSRLFFFAGFNLEQHARQLPSSMQKEWQELIAPSFPLKLAIDARGHLDEMKRDLDFLTTGEVMGLVQKSGKDFFMSFVPNPAGFFSGWKDWFVIAFCMRYSRAELERMYVDMLRGYQRMTMLLREKLAAEHGNRSGGEEQGILWQTMDYEEAILARVGTSGTVTASDLRDATSKNRRALQRLIQAMCNPEHLLNPHQWSMSDLLAEVEKRQATGKPDARCELELERRLNVQLDALLLQHQGKPGLEEQMLRLREARAWRQRYREASRSYIW
jgi:anti-anti-sigma regulatory factor